MFAPINSLSLSLSTADSAKRYAVGYKLAPYAFHSLLSGMQGYIWLATLNVRKPFIYTWNIFSVCLGVCVLKEHMT